MATVGSANIDITADDSQARQEVSGFFGFLSGAGRIATGVMAGLAAFETVKTTFAAIGTATIGANANMETYLNTLTVVLKSNDKAKETLAWAEKFAATTPFEIPEIVEATTRLSAYGLNAQKVLGATGDMAAVMGKPLMQAVEAVADAQTGELERLKEFGITKKMLIEQAAKMGKDEVVNAKGQIVDQKAFNDALFALMNERFKGGMEIQSRTFKGMISNIKDSMGSIAREMSQPLFEGLKKQLTNIVPIMSAATQAIKGNWSGVKEILSGAFDEGTALKIENFFLLIGAKVNEARQWFESFRPSIENLKTIFLNLLPIIQMVGGVIAVAFQKLASLIPPIANGLTSVVAKFTSWSAFVPVITGLIAAFVSYRTIMAAVTAVETARNVVQTVSIALAKAQRAAHLAMVLSGGGVRGMLLAMQAAMRALNITMLANPFVLIASLLVGLGVALVVAYQKSETFRNVVNSAWASVKAGFQSFINFFTTTLPAWVQSVVGWFQNLGIRIKERWNADIAQIKAFFVGLWTGLVSIAQSIYTSLVATWNSLGASISSFVTSAVALWLSFKTRVIAIITPFVAAMQNYFNVMVARIRYILTPFVSFFINSWNNLKLVVLGIVSIFLSLITADFEGFKLGVLAIVTGIKNQVTNIFTTLGQVAVRIFNTLKNSATNIFNTLKTAVINSANALKNGASRAWTSTKTAVVNTANSLKTGAVNAWNSLKSGVVNAANSLRSGAVNAWNSTKSGVVNAANSLRSGAVNAWNSLKSGVSSAVNGIKSAAVNGFNSAKTGAVNAVKNMVSGVTSGIRSIVNKFTELKNKVVSTVKGIDLKKAGKQVIQGFIDGIGSMAGKAAAKVKGIADDVKSAIKGALKIKSPSRIFEGYGENTGEGYILGLDAMIKATIKKARELGNAAKFGIQKVGNIAKPQEIPFTAKLKNAIPQISNIGASLQSTSLAAGTINDRVVVEVPVFLDRREIARVVAPDIDKELNRIQNQNKRAKGVV